MITRYIKASRHYAIVAFVLLLLTSPFAGVASADSKNEHVVYLPLTLSGPGSQAMVGNDPEITDSFVLYLDDLSAVTASGQPPSSANGFEGFDSSVLGHDAQIVDHWLTYEGERCLQNPFGEDSESLSTYCGMLGRTLSGDLTDFEREMIARNGGALLSGAILAIPLANDDEVSASALPNATHPGTGESLLVWISKGWWTPNLSHFTQAGGSGGTTYSRVVLRVANHSPAYDSTYHRYNTDNASASKYVGYFQTGNVLVEATYYSQSGTRGFVGGSFNY